MKIFISLSRNIYNTEEVKQEIKKFLSRTSSAYVKRWLNSNLKNYLIKDYKEVTEVRRAKVNDPDWVKRAIKNNDLQKIDFKSRKWNEFKQNIEHAIPYLESQRNPSRVSVENAIFGGKKLIEEINRKSSDEEDLQGIEVLHEFPDKYSFVSIKSKQETIREGKLMQHCTHEGQDYWNKIQKGLIKLWSLRDPHNKPHCTIEYDIKRKKIKQIKGKQNQGVIKKYQPYVIKFLELMEKQKKVNEFDKYDLINTGILEIEGVWYDLDNLPENLTVNGTLDFEETPITSLPENLTVNGNLYLSKTSITTLPKGLKVNGDLDLEGTSITTLPKGLTVGGYLDLTNTPITSLPEGLKVGESLYLEGTSITDIPEDAKIGGRIIIGLNK